MYITFSSVHTDVLKSFFYHDHHEQLITETATKGCSLEMNIDKFLKSLKRSKKSKKMRKNACDVVPFSSSCRP